MFRLFCFFHRLKFQVKKIKFASWFEALWPKSQHLQVRSQTIVTSSLFNIFERFSLHMTHFDILSKLSLQVKSWLCLESREKIGNVRSHFVNFDNIWSDFKCVLSDFTKSYILHLFFYLLCIISFYFKKSQKD